MGYGDFGCCSLLWVILPESKECVGCSDVWSGDEARWIDEKRKHNWGVK